jgi:hypothetical protein
LSKFHDQPVRQAVREAEALWRDSKSNEAISNWLGFSLSVRKVNERWEPHLTLFSADQPNPGEAWLLALSSVIGIPTEIVVVGSFEALQGPEVGAGKAVVARFNGTPELPGSAGALLRDAAGVTWLMSANHVLSFNGRANPSIHIDLPSASDPLISQTVRDVPIRLRDNNVDVAVCKLAGAAPAQFYAPIPELQSAAPVIPGDYKTKVASAPRAVVKAGAVTGHTRGLATGVETNARVKLTSLNLFSVDFDDVLVVSDDTTAFADSGDSGSLVVDVESGQPVGILFARSTQAKFSLVAYLDTALSQLAAAGHGPYSVLPPTTTP